MFKEIEVNKDRKVNQGLKGRKEKTGPQDAVEYPVLLVLKENAAK